MDPFDSFVVFSIKHGMGNVNDLHELQTRSVFRGRTASLAPTADAWRLFAPTAGTQCLSRLRRAHSVFRAYGGHTVPFAPTASPKEANCEEFAFRSIWEGPTEARKTT